MITQKLTDQLMDVYGGRAIFADVDKQAMRDSFFEMACHIERVTTENNKAQVQEVFFEFFSTKDEVQLWTNNLATTNKIVSLRITERVLGQYTETPVTKPMLTLQERLDDIKQRFMVTAVTYPII